MYWFQMAETPGSTVLVAAKPVPAMRDDIGHNITEAVLERQFRLAARVAFGCRGGGRCRRAHETPADRGSLSRVLADHDLGGGPGSVVRGQEYAVFEFDLVLERLEGPDVAVGEHQHDAACIAETACFHRRVQMK